MTRLIIVLLWSFFLCNLIDMLAKFFRGSNFPVAAFYDTIIESLLTIYVYIISWGSVGGCAVKPILAFYAVAGVLSMSQQLSRSITTPRVTSSSMAMVFSLNANECFLPRTHSFWKCLQKCARKRWKERDFGGAWAIE